MKKLMKRLGSKKIFCIISFIMIAIFLICVFASIKVRNSFFFGDLSDTFMDFYNSVRDAKDKTVYSEQNVIYPPLINIMYFIYSKMMPKELVYTSFQDRYLLQDNVTCQIVFWIYAIINVILLFIVLFFSSKEKKNNVMLFFTIIFSMPFMWAFERGNSILLCLPFLLCFILYKDSDKKYLRIISYISFGISCAIKIYPVFYSLLLLKQKRYKDFFYLTCITFLICVSPVIFYDGLDCIKYLIRNILNFSSDKLNPGYYVSSLYLYFVKNGISTKIILFITEIIFAFAFIKQKEEWKNCLIITLVILNIPACNTVYNLIYLIVPFVIFMNSKNENKVFLVLMGLLFIANPVILSFLEEESLWYNLTFPSLFGLMLYVSLDTLFEYKDRRIELY